MGHGGGDAVGGVVRIVLRRVDGIAKVAGWIGKLTGRTIELQDGGPLSAPPSARPPRVPRLAGARAAGGPVRGGSLYLVGEKGPEIFRPARAGRVLTTAASAAMLGATAAAAAPPRTMPAIHAAALAAVSQAAPSRGGDTFNITIPIHGAHDPEATGRVVEATVRRVLADMSRRQDARLTD